MNELKALNEEISRLRQLAGQQPQVAIYTTIAELSRTKVRDADIEIEGIDKDWLAAKGIQGLLVTGAFRRQAKVSQPPTARMDVGNDDTVDFGVIENVDLLNKIIATLQKQGALKKLAEPTLLTTSGRPASFKVGGEFPVVTPGGLGTTCVEFVEYGVRLDCVPILLGNGRLRLEIRPSVSEIDESRKVIVDDVTVPGLTSRCVDSAVELGVGETLVLAGLAQERVTHEEQPAGVAEEDATSKTEQIELIVTARCELSQRSVTARKARVPTPSPTGPR
jgi:pilus assembly protein CpaC